MYGPLCKRWETVSGSFGNLGKYFQMSIDRDLTQASNAKVKTDNSQMHKCATKSNGNKFWSLKHSFFDAVVDDSSFSMYSRDCSAIWKRNFLVPDFLQMCFYLQKLHPAMVSSPNGRVVKDLAKIALSPAYAVHAAFIGLGAIKVSWCPIPVCASTQPDS